MQSQFGSYYAVKWATRQSTLFSPLYSLVQGVMSSTGVKPGVDCLDQSCCIGWGEEESLFSLTQVTLA